MGNEIPVLEHNPCDMRMLKMNRRFVRIGWSCDSFVTRRDLTNRSTSVAGGSLNHARNDVAASRLTFLMSSMTAVGRSCSLTNEASRVLILDVLAAFESFSSSSDDRFSDSSSSVASLFLELDDDSSSVSFSFVSAGIGTTVGFGRFDGRYALLDCTCDESDNESNSEVDDDDDNDDDDSLSADRFMESDDDSESSSMVDCLFLFLLVSLRRMSS